MKTLIIYDSMYGNTEKIAKAIGEAITGEVMLLRASEASPSDVKSVDLLIIGSPTQVFKATKAVQGLIEGFPKDSLKGMKVATFDTRIRESEVGKGLRFMMKIGGYAAPRIAAVLKTKGGKVVSRPEGFFVRDKEGPLIEGELERATAWAKGIEG